MSPVPTCRGCKNGVSSNHPGWTHGFPVSTLGGYTGIRHRPFRRLRRWNLAMNLMRYLVEHEGVMLLPRAVLLWSPWLDLAVNFATFEKNPRFKTDYIISSFVRWATRAYLGDLPANHPYMSPCGNEFATPIPIFLQTCTAEILHDEHMKFVHSMMNISGNRLKLFQSPHAPHDIFAAGQILGFKQETLRAIDAASIFISDHSLATKE